MKAGGVFPFRVTATAADGFDITDALAKAECCALMLDYIGTWLSLGWRLVGFPHISFHARNDGEVAIIAKWRAEVNGPQGEISLMGVFAERWIRDNIRLDFFGAPRRLK